MSEQDQSRRISDDRLLRLEQSHDMLVNEVHALTLKVTQATAAIDGWRGNHEHMIEDMKHLIRRHDMQLNGDGSTANPGLMVNHDRLKNITDARTWHIRTLWVSMLGMIGAWLSNLFHK